DADQMENAEATLAEATCTLSPDSRLLGAAMGAEALHQWSRADAGYQQLLNAQPDDPLALQRAARFYLRTDEPKRAEPLLRCLLAQSLLLSLEEIDWARRQLAQLLADVQEANSLLDQAHALCGVETLAAQRARAFVDAIQPEKR